MIVGAVIVMYKLFLFNISTKILNKNTHLLLLIVYLAKQNKFSSQSTELLRHKFCDNSSLLCCLTLVLPFEQQS
jgi:hypothetical protein